MNDYIKKAKEIADIVDKIAACEKIIEGIDSTIDSYFENTGLDTISDALCNRIPMAERDLLAVRKARDKELDGLKGKLKQKLKK